LFRVKPPTAELARQLIALVSRVDEILQPEDPPRAEERLERRLLVSVSSQVQPARLYLAVRRRQHPEPQIVPLGPCCPSGHPDGAPGRQVAQVDAACPSFALGKQIPTRRLRVV